MSDFHLYAERDRIASAPVQHARITFAKSEFERFGPKWTLLEAKRLAFENGVDDGSRITALRDLLRDVR